MSAVTIGSVGDHIEPHAVLSTWVRGTPTVNGKQPTTVQVSLNRAAKPGRIAFKRDGSILRSYRLGGWALPEYRAPAWVLNVVDDVMAGARP